MFARGTRILLLAGLAQAVTACGDTTAADGSPDGTPGTRPATVGRAALPHYRDVLILSLDGLRSDALLAVDPETIPNLQRLLSGASTLNARTDPDFTITMPNHTGMVTSRTVEGPGGHRWRSNDPPEGSNLEENLGEPVDNVFRAAQRAGISSAMFATKRKFRLWPWTWNADPEDPAIQTVVLEHKQTEPVLDALLAYLQEHRDRPDLIVVHLHDLDTAGHAKGWNLTRNSPYLQTLVELDAKLGRLLDTISTTPELAASTAIVMTADHGGGVPYLNHHGQGLQWVNYVIPFAVWSSDGQARGDLYALNPKVRADPSLGMPPADQWPPPVRNLDAGNLALGLLGLEPLLGANVNAGQELAVR